MPFRPGVGVGGHCIPVDPLYLTWWASQNGQQAKIVELADQISTSMPAYVARRALALVPEKSKDIKVLLLGSSIEPNNVWSKAADHEVGLPL